MGKKKNTSWSKFNFPYNFFLSGKKTQVKLIQIARPIYRKTTKQEQTKKKPETTRTKMKRKGKAAQL